MQQLQQLVLAQVRERALPQVQVRVLAQEQVCHHKRPGLRKQSRRPGQAICSF